MDMNYRGGMWEGGGGQVGVEWGGEWDNCNSIINKYIKKKEQQYKLVFRIYRDIYPCIINTNLQICIYT